MRRGRMSSHGWNSQFHRDFPVNFKMGMADEIRRHDQARIWART